MSDDKNAGKQPPSRIRKFAVRGILLLMVLAVLGYAGWRYVAQRWNADQVIRQNVIPQLEAQLGEPIEVGAIESNYFNRVQLHDVTVGKNARLPSGALFRAREIDISVNIPSLVFGRRDALQAINGASLLEPSLYIERNRQGKFNLSSLFEGGISSQTIWTGLIKVRNGTLIYQDQALRNANNQPLNLVAQQVAADVRFNGQEPVVYSADAAKVLFNKGATLPGLKLTGTASPHAEWIQNRIQLAGLPAPLLSSYLFQNKLLHATRGTLGGIIHFNWSEKRGIEYNGSAQLSTVAAQIDARSLSSGLTPLAVTNANGGIQFDEHTITLQKLQLQAHNGPLRLDGSVIYGIGKPAFDITARSSRFSFARWGNWLKPVLQNATFSSAPGVLSLRLAGNADRIATRGTLDSRQFHLQQSQLGNFSAARLSAGWNGWILPGKTLQTNLLFNLKGSGAALRHPQGNVSAAAWQGKLQLQNADALIVKGQLQSSGITAQSSSGESLQSARADITIAHHKSTFIQFSGTRTIATSPQMGRAASNNVWGMAEISEKTLTLQGQLQGFDVRSARYGNATGKSLRVSTVKALPLNAQTAWKGNVALQDSNLSQVKLAAISPQLATYLQQPGKLSGTAQFFWDAKNPQVIGQFQLSQLTVSQDQQKVLLRDIKSTFSYAEQHLQLHDLTAQSPYGPLNGLLSADIGHNDFALLVQAPRAHFNARELNPYLAAQHITLQGTANGRLWLAAGGSDQTQIHAQFDLQLPASKVLFRQAHIQATNAHLRGQVKGTFNGNNNWQFETDAALSGKNGSFAQSGTTASLGNFRLMAQGQVRNTKGKIQPALEGTFTSTALKLAAFELRQPVALANLETKWQWQDDAWIAPRLQAEYAGGDITGHLTLTAGDQLDGAFLGRHLQVDAISRWLQTARPGLLHQTAASGNGFIKATLGGNLNQPEINLQGQIYDGALRWDNDGNESRLPLDMVRLQTQLRLGQNESTFTIPLQQFTVWSGGTRLDATGNLNYLPDKSTFAYDADVAIDGLQLANAMQNWPLLAALHPWQQASGTDGVLNARLHLTGQGAEPHIGGAMHLRLAQSYGTALRDVHAQLDATLTGGNPVVHLGNVTGEVARAPFTADLVLDAERHLWTASAEVSGIDAFELLDFSQDFAQDPTPDRGTIHLSRLPLRGTLNARFQATGPVHFDAGTPDFRIADGALHVTSPQLSWHSEALGALQADFQLQPDFLQIQQVKLQSSDAANPRLLTFSGAVPWNVSNAGLDTKLHIQNARLSFISLLLDQTRQVWRRTGKRDVWEQLIQWKNDLPPGTEGNISLDTRLTGQLDSPNLEVSSFKVRDASARTPGLWGQGPVHPLPDIDAAGVYKNGALSIDTFEARLPADNPEEEDLLLHTVGPARIEPGGAINMDLELLHGRLQDLSLWIAALRKDDGSSALQGEVGQVALHVEGTTAAPHVIGSFEANNLIFHDYTLDRLRVSRFDIADGALSIRPGNFTVVKGDYQSSTGWGFLPWNWGNEKPLGLVRNRAMEVHLPLQDKDFGALTGLFLPAVTGAHAEVFRGSLDITGTLDNPQLNGIATIQGGQLALNVSSATLRGGITGLAGTLRFTNGNTLEIDPTDPLRGQLISASAINLPETGNRPKSTFINRPGGEPYLDGSFQIKGQVALDMEAIRLTSTRRNLAEHHYDLQLMLHDATVASSSISGLRNINLAMLWQTGSEDPANHQNLRWIMNANGVNQRGDVQGNVLGFGDFTLDPAFATNLDHLLAVHSNPFARAADFAALGLTDAKQLFANLPQDSIEGKTGSIQFNHYGVAIKDVASGQLDGTLNLQNSDAGMLRVSGNIDLSHSKLTALPAQTEGGGDMIWPNTPLLDVRFDLGDDVNFSSSNLQATLGGYLNITGTPFNPLLLGTFDIRRGQAIFPGARARITEGEIGVTIRRDALTGQLLTRTDIDATAEGRSGRYLITLHLHGPLDTGQNTDQTLLVDISSDPPLSRDEAFAQLLGTAVFNANNLENRDQAYAQMVIGMLSGPLFSGLENTLAETFGLSSLTLDYQMNEAIGIEVGKAIGDRLYLSYRRSIGKTSGESTPYEFRLEYRIKGNWELGVKLNERDQKTLTLEKRWRF